MSYCYCNPVASQTGGSQKNDVKIESYVKVVTGGLSDEMLKKLEGIEEGANKYVLPNATEEVLGGIKVGDGLKISDDGTLSIDPDETCDCGDTQILDGGNAEGNLNEDGDSEIIQYLDGGDSDGIWD